MPSACHAPRTPLSLYYDLGFLRCFSILCFYYISSAFVVKKCKFIHCFSPGQAAQKRGQPQPAD